MSGPKMEGRCTGVTLLDGTRWPDPVWVADASWWLRYGLERQADEFSQAQRYGMSSAMSAYLTLITHPCGMDMLRQLRKELGR